jgi:hypothetical protein
MRLLNWQCMLCKPNTSMCVCNSTNFISPDSKLGSPYLAFRPDSVATRNGIEAHALTWARNGIKIWPNFSSQTQNSLDTHSLTYMKPVHTARTQNDAVNRTGVVT